MSLADYPAAYADWTKAIELAKPPTADMHLQRAICSQSMELFPGLLADANSAIELDPENVEAWELRYDALKWIDFFDKELLETARTLAKLSPNDPGFVVSLLIELGSAKDYEGVEKEATRFLDEMLDERRLDNIYCIRGEARFELGRYEAALNDYNQGFQRAERGRLTYIDFRGRRACYAKLGRYDEALGDYAAALKEWRSAWFLFERAGIFAEMKEYQKALADLDEAGPGLADVDNHREFHEIRLKRYEGLGGTSPTTPSSRPRRSGRSKAAEGIRRLVVVGRRSLGIWRNWRF